MTVLLALFIAGLIVLAFGGGVIVGARSVSKAELARLGFTPEAAKLYKRGARLMARMQTVTDLDGDGGADLLSARSKELIGEWLADYRKQIERI